MDARVNTAGDPSTSDKNVVNLWSITPEYELHAELRNTFQFNHIHTRWYLPGGPKK